MLYYDDLINRLLISTPVFAKLETQTDVAASWLHETIYKLARDRFFATSSVTTRLVVGCLFSDSSECLANNNLKSIFKSYTKVQFCKSNDVEYYKGVKIQAEYPSTLIAVKRAGQFDLSSNYALSASFSENKGQTSLESLGLNPWMVTWVETSGGYWPTPTGLTVRNRLTGEYYDPSDAVCTEINL